jgi:hypothetical protein
MYSTMYFKTRIQPKLTEELQRLKEASINEESLVTISQVTKACWEGETQEICQEVAAAIEAEHLDALGSFRVDTAGDSTIAEYVNLLVINSSLMCLQGNK